MRRLLAALVVATALATASGVAVGARAHGTLLDGRWKWTVTRAEALSCCQNAALAGPSLAEFRDGRIYALDPGTGRLVGLRGTYTVAGNLVTFVFSHKYPAQTPIPGKPYLMRFSLYRDRLTWSMVPGRPGLTVLPAAPWVRVGD
jgi:hypothetical protein